MGESGAVEYNVCKFKDFLRVFRVDGCELCT